MIYHTFSITLCDDIDQFRIWCQTGGTGIQSGCLLIHSTLRIWNKPGTAVDARDGVMTQTETIRALGVLKALGEEMDGKQRITSFLSQTHSTC